MTRERIEAKLARRPVFAFRPDHSGTIVRCHDGFARVRRDCVRLEDGRWEYVGNSAAAAAQENAQAASARDETAREGTL